MSTSRPREDDKCLSLRMECDSDVLFVSFSSNKPYPGPVFEFSGGMAKLGALQILLRDPRRLWYHLGLPGIGPNVDTVAETLEHLRLGCRARRTITLGISAGGYAAILFGLLLGVEEVFAFAPQTKLTELADSRTPGRIEALHAAVGAENPYLDLRSLLTSMPASATRIHLFYSDEDALDSRHVRHLQDLPNIEIYPVDCKGHRIVRRLKDDGRLERILSCAMQGDTDRDQIISLLNEPVPGSQ